MIDIFKNNLNEFDINNKSNNTIICNANELEYSYVLNSLSPIQKSNIHLNIKIHSDKDIENFIFLEQDCHYKSINIILDYNFNLSKTACKKLETLVNLNSVFKSNNDNKFKGCSFKNYYITTAIPSNSDTSQLLSNDSLYILKNFSKKENNYILFYDIKILSKEIIDFLNEKNYDKVYIKINSNIILNFKINLLYTIFERINNYTNSININIENNIKFNIIFKKILNDIKCDFDMYNNNFYNNPVFSDNINSLYNDLLFSGYHYILFQTLKNLNINTNMIFCKTLDNNKDTYYIQVLLDKYWFNSDIIWSYNHLNDSVFLKSDKEFFETHSTDYNDVVVEKCPIEYKKFYKKYNFFRIIKNKLALIFSSNKNKTLALPEPSLQVNNNSIFQYIDRYK